MIRIYLGNLPMAADESELRRFLIEHGREATKIDLKRNASTGKSRGFAFLDFATEDEAASAVGALNGADFGGRALRASDAKKAQVAFAHDDEPDDRRGRPRGRGGRNR